MVDQQQQANKQEKIVKRTVVGYSTHTIST